MDERHDVELFFDFVSPYSYLALTQVLPFGRRHGVAWRLRPVVYGALLDATGLIGPAEVRSKRRYTFRDIGRTAQLLGVPLVGPPAHPFRSLEALRTTCLWDADPRAVELAVALSHACWGEGRDLTDLAVLAEVVAGVGLDAAGLPERIAADEVKAKLREHTEAALAAGVFGVPTFRFGEELFWGNDRLEHLAARLSGRLGDAGALARSLEQRPRAADRAASPLRNEGADG